MEKFIVTAIALGLVLSTVSLAQDGGGKKAEKKKKGKKKKKGA